MKMSKCFFLLMVLLAPSVTLPCSQSPVTFIKTQELSQDPTKAKSVYVGVINEKNGNIVLNVERSWTAPPLIAVYVGATQDPCPHENYLPNVKYLFYALNDYQAFVKKSSWIFVMEPLKGSRGTIEKFSSKDFVGEINPSWQFCEDDLECVQLKNQCGNLIGVNKKHKKDYLFFLKTKKAKLDCLKAGDTKIGISKCVENFCS